MSETVSSIMAQSWQPLLPPPPPPRKMVKHSQATANELFEFVDKTYPNFTLMFNLYSNAKDSKRSLRRCSIKKVVLENLVKSTGKHLCRSHFLNKVASLRPEALESTSGGLLLQKTTKHRNNWEPWHEMGWKCS